MWRAGKVERKILEKQVRKDRNEQKKPAENDREAINALGTWFRGMVVPAAVVLIQLWRITAANEFDAVLLKDTIISL